MAALATRWSERPNHMDPLLLTFIRLLTLSQPDAAMVAARIILANDPT